MAKQTSSKTSTTKKTNTKAKATAKKKTTTKPVKKATPKKTASKKPAPKKTTPKKPASKKATPKKTTVKIKTNTAKKIEPIKIEVKETSSIKAETKKPKNQKLIKFGIHLAETITLLAIFIVVLVVALKKPKVKIKLEKNSYKVVDRVDDIKKYKKYNDYTIVGWIKVQGTNIDYPVLFYDTAPISDVRQNIGWIYETPKKLQERTVIEGHNILNMSSNPAIANKDSKRFEQLMSFTDEKFAANNKYIQYTTNSQNYVFKIYAISFPEYQVYYTQSNLSKEEKKAYVQDALKNSLYKYDVDVTESDKLISLYTCTRFYGYSKSVSFRIDGRLVRSGESRKDYKMETTKEYENAKNYANSVKKSQEVNS